MDTPIASIPDGPAGEYLTDRLTRDFVGWLRTERDPERPFFACLWHYAVHAPFQAPDDRIAAARDRVDPDDPQRCPTYAAMVEALDGGIGRVLAALDELGLAEDTVVVFTSDNGGNMYDDVGGVPPTSNAPLRGGKGTIDEGGIRVPLVVVWPGRVEAGSTTDALATSCDLFPTVLEMAGVPARPELHVDGLSLADALAGGDGVRDEVPCHFPHDVAATGNLAATSVRVGDLKLVRSWHDALDGMSDREALYDLGTDPGEVVDLAGARPSDVARLAARIDAFVSRTDALVPRRNPAFDPATEWWTARGDARVVFDGNTMTVESDGEDPGVTTHWVPPIRGRAVLEFEARSEGDGHGQVFWAVQGTGGFAEERSATFEVPVDGGWHAVRVVCRLGRPLASLRVDTSRDAARVELRNVRLRNVGGAVVRAWRFAAVR